MFSASVAPGWTNEVIGSKFGWSDVTVHNYLTILEYNLSRFKSDELTTAHVIQAKTGTGGDKALAAIKEKTDWTNEVIGSKFGWSDVTVHKYLEMLEYENLTQVKSDLSPKHLVEAKAGTGGDKNSPVIISLEEVPPKDE